MARSAPLLENYPNQVRLCGGTKLWKHNSSEFVTKAVLIPVPVFAILTGDSLNFGVSTLEEIRLRKALKASMKRAGYPMQNADSSTNREKENIRSLFQPPLFEARDGKEREHLDTQLLSSHILLSEFLSV